MPSPTSDAKCLGVSAQLLLPSASQVLSIALPLDVKLAMRSCCHRWPHGLCGGHSGGSLSRQEDKH